MGLLGLFLSGCVSAGYVTQAPAYSEQDQPEQVTYQSFYDNLSPYGNWIDYPQYGHVWNPRVSSGFRPYATNGQWRYSNDGWAWQSNYNWGWAPFHYGRWLLDDNYGWLWVPGYDWSPAWVTWGRMDNNYAWAPLMPGVNVGMEYNNWRPNSSYWNIVPRERLGDRNISNVIVHYGHDNNINSNNTTIHNSNTTIVNNTNITRNITIINNYNTSRTNNYYSKGPEVGEVEKYTHNKIQPVAFRDVHQIGRPSQSATQMDVYRPVVQNPHPSTTGQGLYNGPANGAPNYPADNPLRNNGNNGNAIKNQYNSTNSVGNPKPVPNELSTPVPVQNNHPVMDANQSGATNLQGAPTNAGGNIQRDINQQPVRQRQSNQNGTSTTPTNNVAPVQQLPASSNQAITQQQQQQQQQQRQQERQQQQNVQNRDQNSGRAPNQVNQSANSNQVQPRMYRRVDPNQTRPIRNEAQTPVMQPRQQQRNVEQLPIQRQAANNGNSKPNREQDRR